jgi:hypothetical protein
MLKAIMAFLVLFSTALQAQITDPPTAIEASSVSTNSFIANWEPVPGATSYQLDVSTSPTFGNTVLAPDLIISEYVEGDSGYHAIEIYNGTGADVAIGGYILTRYSDGSTTPSTNIPLAPAGSILPNNATFVKAYNSGIAPDLLAVTDHAVNFSLMNFDGNDVIVLARIVSSVTTQIDAVGVIGQVTPWGEDVTLRRKASVTAPSLTYSPDDWEVYPMNDITGLGSHAMDNFTPSFVPGYEDLTVNGTSQTVSGIDQNSEFYYRVRAIGPDGTSINSNVIQVRSLPVAPVAIDAASIGATSFTANWEPVPGATGYELDVSTSPTFGTQILASDLMISEYVEGNAGYKAVELYNGTGADVTLTGNYLLRRETDGTGAFVGIFLSGVIPNNSTRVYAYATGIAPDLESVADVSTTAQAMDFDGNDVMQIFKISGTQVVDAVGVANQAANWGADVTLRRKASVTGPSATYAPDDWDAFPTDDITGLGSHTIDNIVPSFVPGYENLTVVGTSQLVSGLDPNTNYYYRVRAVGPEDTSENSNVINALTLEESTFGSIAAAPGVVCEDTAATFNLAGLSPSSTYTISYNIDGGATQTAAGVIVDASGNATMEVTLSFANNGQILTVTAVERTDVPSSIEQVTANNTVVLSVAANVLYYADNDLDGYGDGNNTLLSCQVVPGFILDNTDCDDNNAAVHPGATEIGYNLIDDNCDGAIDEGFPPKNTVIQTAQCNTILAAIDTKLVANLVGGAQRYRWQITTMNGPSAGQVQFLDTPLRTMKITQLADYAFDTQYKVELAVLYAGFWQPFRASDCTVTTPVATTRLSTCGQTLTAMSDIIYADIVPFSTGYRFRIVDPLDVSHTQVIDRQLREFRMDLITDFVVQFGKQYNVEVAVRNTDGSYLPYGAVCTITTPEFPTTSLQASQCDYIVPTASTQIYAVSYPGAIGYAFEVSGPGLDVPVEVVKTIRTFTLNDFPSLLPGTTYNVRVRLIFDSTDPAGPYGNVCTITTSGLARPIAGVFDAVAYPNPFSNDFNIDVVTAAGGAINIKAYDMTGRLLGQINTKASGAVPAMGNDFPAGVYNIVVTQGDQTKTLRVIKR